METIKSSREISELFASGRRLKNPYVTFILKEYLEYNPHDEKEQHDQMGRVAFIAGKKSGNAVWRSKAKRRLRALCKDLGGPWEGHDVIFLANPSLISFSYSKVLCTCVKTLSRSSSIGRNTIDE